MIAEYEQEDVRKKSVMFGFLKRLRGSMALLAFLMIPSATLAQSAYFSIGHQFYGTVIYTSPQYRTMTEAVARMYDYVQQQWPEGRLFTVWYYGSVSVYSPRMIAFRVRPEKPKIYGRAYSVAPLILYPNSIGSTPDEACQIWANEGGYPQFLQPTEYVSTSNGGGYWRCVWFGMVPEIDCTPCGVSVNLSGGCDQPRMPVRNDDPSGEMTCGSWYSALVVSSDRTPDRPDECTEGNPIVPASAQKVHRETDYDDGRLLKFERNYGSQRFGLDVVGYTPWRYTYFDALPAPTAGSLATAALRADGTLALIYADDFTGSLSSTTADMAYRGTVATIGGARNYTLFSPYEPTVERYGSDGRLLSRSYADGRFVVLTYADGKGGYLPGGSSCTAPVSPAPFVALQCVTDAFGRQLAFEWNSAGLRTKLIDPAGGVVQYAYDESTSHHPEQRGPIGNLTSVTRQDGTVRLYHYNEPEHTSGTDLYSALTGISDPLASGFVRYSVYKYDDAGRAVMTEHAGGADRHSVSYASDMTQATVTRPLGSVFTHSLSKQLGALRRSSTAQPPGAGSSACSDARTFDGTGNISSRTDFGGNKSCFAYDNTRNLQIRRVEGVPDSAVCSSAMSSPPAGARVTHTQWHPDWPLVVRTAEPKKIATFVYNGHGATCAPNTVLIEGRPPAVICSYTEQATTDETGAAGFSASPVGSPRTWTYTYATYGRVLTATDPNGKTSYTTYYPDDDPDLGRRGNVATVTNAVGHITRFTTYNLHGQPVQIIAANGKVTDLTYDARMRVTHLSVGNELTTFTYDPRGLLVNVTHPDGGSISYTYDDAQRLVGTQDQLGNRATYVLDALGNRVSEQLADPSGALVRNVQRTMDALDRVQQIVGFQ